MESSKEIFENILKTQSDSIDERYRVFQWKKDLTASNKEAIRLRIKRS